MSPDRYRDNDDVRDPTPSDQRVEVHPDPKNEAHGDARVNVGNIARDTPAQPTGPEGNDRTRNRSDRPDEFDSDLDRSS